MSDAPQFQTALLENVGHLQGALELHRHGDLEAAAAACEAALALRPQDFDALNLLAITAAGRMHFGRALTLIRDAIRVRPTSAAAYFNRGLFFEQLRREDHALANYAQAAQLDPNLVLAYLREGMLLQRSGRLDVALESYNRAIERAPQFPEAYVRRAIVLQDLGRVADALASVDSALRTDPSSAHAHSVRGYILMDLGRWGEAVHACDRAIAVSPSYVDAHLNRACARLVQGDFERGLVDYEWRPLRAGVEWTQRVPRWSGREPVAGKTVVLYGEQGLGDTIQFCRYAQLVAQRGAKVILHVAKPLRRLLEGLEGVEAVVSSERDVPACDYACPLLSLPLAFATTIDSIPSRARYLRADPAEVERWRVRLQNDSRPCIALAWRGNPRHPRDSYRSVPLELLARSLPDGFRYVALSPELTDDERAVLSDNAGIEHAQGDLGTIAAVCEGMDLVISVDTSLAHLSAALGRKTWILLPFNPDWRWLLHRDDSPWYPSVRLFRQSRAEEWAETLDRMRDALMRRFAHR